MIRLLACAALLSFPQTLVAAETQACLTRQEVGTLMLFAAPMALENAAQKCAPVLPANAFLRTDAHKTLANTIRAEVNRDLTGLKQIFEKLAEEKLPPGIKESTLRTLMEEVLGAQFNKDLQVKDCTTVDQLALALSPLPPKNTATIVGTLAAMGDDGKGSFRMCKPS